MFGFLSLYGLLALTHLFNQINFSHREYLNSLKGKTIQIFPTVAIIIPSYNESVKDLENCVKSAIKQDYPNDLKIIVIDDGSKDKRAIRNIKRKFGNNEKVVVKEFRKNKGKRHAQKLGFDFIGDSVEIIVTIDSDTVLARDTISHLVQQFADPKVGAVTGDVRVFKSNLLSKLIDARYWTAFNQERAAQSLFGTVLCCSGPLAAYRTSIVQKVKNKYITQVFLGNKCTYGDDRHLTNLVLEQGYSVKFERKSKAFTYVPEKLKPWLRQQARWNRSFYREMLWTAKRVVSKRNYQSIYMVYDLAMQAVLPFLLLFSLTFVFTMSLMEGPAHLFGYITILVGIAVIRGSYAYLRTKDRVFFLFPLYAFCHIFLLIPVRMYALCTLKTTKWGTR